MLAAMSTRDKLAQLLMVGIRNGVDARAVVGTYHVGGIMVGSWTDLSMLSGRHRRRYREHGPAAAGGECRRGGRPGLAVVLADRRHPAGPHPGPDQDPDDVGQIAGLRPPDARHGITVDFAPVGTSPTRAPTTVIGDRSFSNDPATVTAYAGAFARGLRDAGVLPVLKHFPHGHGSGDSHTAGVVMTPPLDQLMASDLRALSDADHPDPGRSDDRPSGGAGADR